MLKTVSSSIIVTFIACIISSCIPSAYLNQKITAPVFMDSSKRVISHLYLGTRKQELNISYAPFKRAFITTDMYLGNPVALRFKKVNQRAYNVGLGYIPLKRDQFQLTTIASIGRGDIDSYISYKDYTNRNIDERYINCDYDRLSLTSYASFLLDGHLSFGVRNSYVRYHSFYMVRKINNDPRRYDEALITAYDTIRFTNKTFVTLDPFMSLDLLPTKHFGINVQVSYSFSTRFKIPYTAYRSFSRLATNELSISQEQQLMPFYKRFMLNIGAYFVF